MENQTRFDLNAAIENWRNELSAQPNFSADDRRELETHLRDLISEFQRKGLNDEESFWIARRRVGQPRQLGEEFVKANPTAIWRERIFWMTTGVLGWWLSGLTIYSIETIFGWSFPAWSRFNDQNFVWLEPLQICVLGALFASGRLLNPNRYFEWFIQKRLRLVVSYVCFMGIASLLVSFSQNETVNWFRMWRYFLANLIIGSGFLLLLIWLLPTQNRKIPKRA